MSPYKIVGQPSDLDLNPDSQCLGKRCVLNGDRNRSLSNRVPAGVPESLRVVIDPGLVGSTDFEPLCEGYRWSRNSMDTYPESSIIKYTSIRG